MWLIPGVLASWWGYAWTGHSDNCALKNLSTGIEASATGESLNSGDPVVHPAARHSRNLAEKAVPYDMHSKRYQVPGTARYVQNQAESAEDAESTSEPVRIQQYAIFRIIFWRRQNCTVTKLYRMICTKNDTRNCLVCDTKSTKWCSWSISHDVRYDTRSDIRIYFEKKAWTSDAV